MKKKLLSIISFCLFTLGLYAKSTSTLRIPFTLSEDGFIVLNFYHKTETFNFEFNLAAEHSGFNSNAMPKLSKSYLDDDRDLKEILIEIYMEQLSVDYSEAEKAILEEFEENGLYIADLEFSLESRTFSNRDFVIYSNEHSDAYIDGWIGPSFFSNVDNIFIDYKESYIEINSNIKGKNPVTLHAVSGEKQLSNYTSVYINAEVDGISQPCRISNSPFSVAKKITETSCINNEEESSSDSITYIESKIKIGKLSEMVKFIKFSEEMNKEFEFLVEKIYKHYNSLGNDFFKDKRILVDYKHKKFYIW